MSRPGARARRVTVEARAKLNLWLAVGPRRTDGYHELATLFQSISLADTLIATPARSGFRLSIAHEDSALGGRMRRDQRGRVAGGTRGRVPLGRDNLVLRAARLVAGRLGLAAGARFRLIKRIPAQSGLGGASADAAATLSALDALYGLGLSLADRLALALELGSDVPFAVLGGTALGRGRGERLTRLELAQPFRALVAVPEWGVSTARAFARMDRHKYGLTGWVGKLRIAEKIRRMRLKPEQALRLGNTLEEALGERRSDFLSLRSRLEAAGASDIRMTGSGSAVFGIVAPGTSVQVVARRFEGSERLFAVRSMRGGLRRSILK